MFPLYDLNPHRRFPWVTVLLIVANVAVMALQGLQPSDWTVYHYGFIPKRVTELRTGKPVVVRPLQLNDAGKPVPGPPIKLESDPAQVYLTFLTAMFLHGGWVHLVMNMWMLWIFGNNIEDRLGWFMYLCFYLLGGIVGTICQWVADPTSDLPMIGASGAVAAVLGGYAITYPKAMVKTLIFFGLIVFVDLPALLVLGIWFLLQMAAGLNVLRDVMGGEHVAFWAHIGGFLAGIVLMPILGLGASPADVDWKREVQELFRFEDPRAPKN
ncbi:MAG: rhomboid family intramembrane serine protease [Pirellulales bacterium]